LHRYTPLYRYDQTCALDSLTYNCYNVRGDYSMMPEFTPEIELEYISEKNILFTFLKRMNSHSHDNEDANVPLIFLWLYSWISRINRFSAKRNYHHSNNRLQKECGYINKYILIDVNDRIFRHLVRGLLCQKLLVIKLLLI